MHRSGSSQFTLGSPSTRCPQVYSRAESPSAREVHAHLEHVLDEARTQVDGVDSVHESRVMDRDPVAVLAEKSSDLDLLVLGSRGYGPLRAVLLGSSGEH